MMSVQKIYLNAFLKKYRGLHRDRNVWHTCPSTHAEFVVSYNCVIPWWFWTAASRVQGVWPKGKASRFLCCQSVLCSWSFGTATKDCSSYLPTSICALRKKLWFRIENILALVCHQNFIWPQRVLGLCSINHICRNTSQLFVKRICSIYMADFQMQFYLQFYLAEKIC